MFSALTLLFGFAGSFRFGPDLGGASFKDRALHKTAPGIKVSISVLGPDESRQSFGEDLARQNIQPIWLSIQNDTEEPLAFLSIALDPDYYSAYEVSYKFHGALSFAANRARDAFFLEREMANVPPRRRAFCIVFSIPASNTRMS